MKYDLHNRVVIITGASEGIGAELARQLARLQCKLVLAARRLDLLEQVAKECHTLGGQAVAVTCDVTQQDQCEALIEAAVNHFGHIDILVNNAGVSMHAWFEDITDLSTYERLFKINVMGPVYCTRAALPELKKSRGLIVGVSSLAGKTGVPARTTYCSSKFAVSGFFEALRIELADTGVDISMIFPGVVATAIRLNGLNADGQRAGISGLEERGAMTVEQCVSEMLEAMSKRKREWIMTPTARFGMVLKSFFPQLVDSMAKAALNKEHGGKRKSA